MSRNIPGFGRGLRGGWAALVNTTKVAATVAGVLLPFAGVALVLAGPVVGLCRALRRREHATPSA